MSTYPASWYPDYAQAGQLRYWDGQQWTQYVHRPDEPGTGKRRKLPKVKPSAQLVAASYRMLLADKSMVGLLFAGAIVAALAGAAVLFPALRWGHITPGTGGGVLGVLVAGVSLGLTSFVIQLVSGAVVAAAMLRAEGRPSSASAALGVAWSRRRQLLAWALLSTLVGSLIRMLERVGIGGLVAALTLNIGWAFATVFATPVIIAEGAMPIATIRRSSSLLRRRFTVILISGVALAAPWIALGFLAGAMILVGAGMVALGGPATAIVGALVLAVGAVGLCFQFAVSGALSAYLETFLYRHAVGLPVPGVDQHWLPPLRP